MYRTKEIAQLIGIHPNTVRVYEKWKFISPVPRQENGYRTYSSMHVFQLKVARTLFRCEIIQGGLRKKAREIVYACGKEDFERAEQLIGRYIRDLQLEYDYALAATDIVGKWLKKTPSNEQVAFSRKEVALQLETTAETIRNWERNGLIDVPKTVTGARIYSQKELEQLQVIRSLRGANYSINAILRLFHHVQRNEPNIFLILNTPTKEEDIVTVTDQLGKSLLDAIADAKQVRTLFRNRTHFLNSMA